MRLRNVLLLSVVVVAGGALALEFAARSTAVRAARTLAPWAILTYDSAGIALDGSVRLDSPRLDVQKGLWHGILKARSVELRGGSRFWLIGQALSSDPELPANMSFVAHGLGVAGSDSVGGVASWVGTRDLVLFENQGCGSDDLGDKDRAKMGVLASERVDHFEFHHDRSARNLEVTFELDSPNIANWQGYLDLSAFDPALWSQSSALQQLRLVRAGLSYRDPGYLARRNTFCARWLGVTSTEFVDRHVEAVKTFLASRGVNPSADVLSLYQRLVTRGGSLNLASLPDSGWVPAEFAAYPRQVLLRQLNITARLDDAPPIMLRLGFSEPEIPLYVVKAGDDPAAVPVPEKTSASEATVLATATTTTTTTTTATAPEPEPLVQTAVVAVEPPAPAPPPDAEAPADSAPRAAVEAAVQDESRPAVAEAAKPSRVDSSGKVIASAPPPPPDSTLALVWEPGVIERLPPQERKKPEYDVVALSSLNQHIGRRVQLLTVTGKRVDGEMHALEPGSIVLLVQVGRGSAKLNVPVSNIREARLLRSR